MPTFTVLYKAKEQRNYHCRRTKNSGQGGGVRRLLAADDDSRCWSEANEFNGGGGNNSICIHINCGNWCQNLIGKYLSLIVTAITTHILFDPTHLPFIVLLPSNPASHLNFLGFSFIIIYASIYPTRQLDFIPVAESCNKDVAGALISMYDCGLAAKIKMNLV
ncbi:uncharacterized protein [Rutidosis leptorrhynchoides]|uniref:uncharacterized protein n=1 Tax=Rutidosis leptorrhynchoides TaxID=125765 RepID=UPI003A9A42BC